MPNSKSGVKRTSVSPSFELPTPTLLPPRPMNRKSTASGSARASTSVKEEVAAGQRGQPSAPAQRESTAALKVKRKPTAPSTNRTQVDNPFALMGSAFAGMDASRLVQGTTANKVATGKSKNEVIYVISDSDSDEEESDVEYFPQETPTKPRQPPRSGSITVKQMPVSPDLSGPASFFFQFEGSQAPFTFRSWFIATHTPARREKARSLYEYSPALQATNPEYWATYTYSAGKGKHILREGKGKEREEEMIRFPSPPPSSSTSRTRRTAQPAVTAAPTYQPPTPQSLPRTTRARPRANPQPPLKPFLPISIVDIPGLNYTLDEYDTVCNDETGGRQYELPSGELLKEYQTTDVDLAMTGSMYRHCLRVEKDKGNPVQHDPDELVQGILLNYEMGLGKTHVACVVLDRGRVHREKINERLGVPDLHLKPDLVIAPLSTHNHWKEHLTRLSEGRLNVRIYGSGRKAFDRSVHVYIVTVETFRNHHDRFGKYQDLFDERYEENPAENTKRDWSLGLTDDDRAWARAEAPFAVTEFNTVVIDESHKVSNSATLSGRALLSVHTDNFLLLTGTPAQNGLDDMQIIFALMVHKSKRNNFREQEKANRMMNRARKEENDKARSLPMKVYEVLGNGFNGSKEIEHFMNSCMITRRFECPETGTVLVKLPQLHHIRVEVLQTPEEQKLYDYVAGVTSGDYRLVRILRKRQAVLHGSLLRKAILGKTSPFADEDAMDTHDDITDEYNVEPSDLELLTIDADAELREAIQDRLDTRDVPSELKQMGLEKLLEPKYISSKFKAIYAIIEQVPKGEKVIIFSIFTSLLDVLGNFLEDNGIEFVQLDGRMNSREREHALRAIADDPYAKVMLVSMKAGGVGLNITSCNHVILFDPWWNPYVEEQAISRAHRIGQTRECYVYRLHSPDTIEDRIVEVAKRKRGPIEAFMARCAVLTNERDAAQKARF
ncbi:hypothetical protein H1R20_g8521, partial [Candolleomyces eurysporus]